MAEVVAVALVAATIVSGVMSTTPLLGPIKRVFSTKTVLNDHKNLTELMDKLLVRKEKHEKDLALWNLTKTPSVAYNDWIQDWIQELSKLVLDVGELNKIFLQKIEIFKYFRSFTCRSLCKKMRKAAEEAVHLESREFGDISSKKEPEKVVKMKEAPDISEFPTLYIPLQTILRLLTKDNIKVIAIHGIIGTGKTSIMQNLNNHIETGSVFQLVIWVDVSTDYSSTNFSIRQMQESIMRRLNLDYGEGIKTHEFAKRIKQELWDKKCLLLLDGVIEDMDFSKIGIDLNYENGSKLVLNSRKGDVCGDNIIGRSIPLKRLTDDEAMKLFTKILGQPPRNPRVVECCDNLPFVIKLIAGAFKKKETDKSWDQGLRNLTMFPKYGDVAIKKVYKYLSFCCSDLEGNERKCFLYCALYPGGMPISEDRLLDCWLAEGLFEETGERELGRHVLDELKNVSLLEEHLRKDGEYVKMQKLIRKVAMDELLEDRECKHLIKAGESLPCLPDWEMWREKHRISLVQNKITTLSQCPEKCPSLSTLLLQHNTDLNTIDNSFFKNTENLRILDLCGTGIKSIPLSLCKLKWLKVLYLNNCTNLARIPSEIGELENLEVLDIRGIRDGNIPSQYEGMFEFFLYLFRRLMGTLKATPSTHLTNIAKMHKLKRLLVSFSILGNGNDDQYLHDYCSVISQVSATLEELVIDVKSYKQHCSAMINIVRDKVMPTMPKLTTLKFYFEDGVEDVIKVIAGTPRTHYPTDDELTDFVRKLDDSTSNPFQLFIGCSISSLPQYLKCDNQRYTKYWGGTGLNLTNISKVLGVTEAFELVNHKNLINVSEFGNESLNKIQSCLIEGCSEITGIADGDYAKTPLLDSVLHLYIKNLLKLECIWKKAPHPSSLSKLETLHLENCPTTETLLVEPDVAVLRCLKELILVNLPNLTSISTTKLPNWPSLEILKIQKCPKLVEFPFTEDNTCNLKKLRLEEVLILNFICAYELLEWPALKKLTIFQCPNLKELPFNNTHAKELKIVKADKNWWNGLQWNDLDVKTRLEPLCAFQEDSTPVTVNGP